MKVKLLKHHYIDDQSAKSRISVCGVTDFYSLFYIRKIVQLNFLRTFLILPLYQQNCPYKFQAIKLVCLSSKKRKGSRIFETLRWTYILHFSHWYATHGSCATQNN